MTMSVTRRRLFQTLAVTGGCAVAADAAEPAVTLDALRNVSAANGINLSDDRLRVVKPVLEERQPQLQALREFDVDDSVEPTNGCF